MERTNRSFINIEDGEIFVLYNEQNSNFRLISDGSEKHKLGTEIKGVYIAAHSAVTLKINNKKQVYLPPGNFYQLKEKEKVTHKKYPLFKKFTKVKN